MLIETLFAQMRIMNGQSDVETETEYLMSILMEPQISCEPIGYEPYTYREW